MKSWKVPVGLVVLEIILRFVFIEVPLSEYFFICGLVFGFLVVVQYTGLGFTTFGQGLMSHKVHRKEMYDIRYDYVANMTKEKSELRISLGDVMLIVFALVNIGLSWLL